MNKKLSYFYVKILVADTKLPMGMYVGARWLFYRYYKLLKRGKRQQKLFVSVYKSFPIARNEKLCCETLKKVKET